MSDTRRPGRELSQVTANASGHLRVLVLALSLSLLGTLPVLAWYTDGHRRIAATAVEKLPETVPKWFRQAAGSVGHYAVDPDLWKHQGTPQLRHTEYPEHFLDLELLRGHGLPPQRYQFLENLERLRLDPARVGMLPYAIVENMQRLTLAFAEARQWPGVPEIQSKAALWAGRLAHYAGDLQQPLHTTIHFDGRVGPDGQTPRSGIHGLTDALIQTLPVDRDSALSGWRPSALRGDPVQAVFARLRASHHLVDRVYHLEKDLRQLAERGAATPALVEFVRQRFRASVDLTAALIFRAWNDSARIELPYWLDRQAPWPIDSGAVDPRAVALAHRTMQAMGGREAFERVRLLHFVFEVERNGESLASYEHWWDRFTGRYRLEGRNSEGQHFVTLFDLDTRQGRVWVEGEELDPAAAAPYLERAYGRFINDSYWLLMPWKWLDPGVQLAWIGPRRLHDERWRVAQLTFESGTGQTSSDRYQAWVAEGSGLMERWEYVLQTSEGTPGEKAPTAWKWSDWKPTAAGILLARTRRRLPDGDLFIRFPIAEAHAEVSETELDAIFAAPE